MGKVQQRPPPPRIPEEPTEGDDQNFASDTNTLIKICQVGLDIHDIRDTDMGGAITYALLELEGVDTELDIDDIGKKGPWIIDATEDCAKQFEAKYGGLLEFTFNGILIKFSTSRTK
jgi:hypothetical protein